jgi:dihydrofolate synthase/folylpolyglutamate synthase
MDKTLSQWLSQQIKLHPKEIDLSLERCHTVAARLDVLNPCFPTIIVGGTNGKGSSVAMLAAIYHAAGFKVGRYISPEIIHYNERISVNQQNADDASICAAFAQIEQARAAVSLTVFEFATLAALLIFHQQSVDVAILEVGLGGRLDAVNIIAADVALVTAMGLDHTDRLGLTLDQIAFEKAGIFRPHRPAICSSTTVPLTLIDHATTHNADLQLLTRDFHYQTTDTGWRWTNQHTTYDLPLPALRGDYQLQNAAGVLQAVTALQPRLPVSLAAIKHGLRQAQITGRFQQLSQQPVCLIDVAHNPLAAQVLATQLRQQRHVKRWRALVGMLKDKDILATFAPLADIISEWHLLALTGERAAPTALLEQNLHQLGLRATGVHQHGQSAYQALKNALSADEGLIVFGSFHTVAAVLRKDQHVI